MPQFSTTLSPPRWFCFNSRSTDSAVGGEAKDFISDGNLELDGRLPINTHGGQLGEGYIHGVNGIAEGVRLIRGTSTNQPTKTLDNVLVTGGSPVPHSALVLSADR